MTDDIASEPTAAATGDSAPQVRVLAQYVKDLSFENPDSPNALRGGLAAPNIDLSIDVQARKAAEDAYEVDLYIKAEAKRDNTVVFIGELRYGGLFQFVNVPDEQLEPLLLIECPRTLFPFARRIMADVTRDGGFPPLFIDPIDFLALYRQQRAGQQGGEAAPAESGDGESSGESSS
jgi:preprotein translocase subunit SecB